MNFNPFAVLLAAIVSMVIGALWYSPMLFGKQWSKFTGVKMDKMKEDTGKIYMLNFIANIVMAYILARFISLTQSTTIMEGLQIGFMGWVGFVATTHLTTTLFQGKRKKLFLIDTGYQMVAILSMATVITLLA